MASLTSTVVYVSGGLITLLFLGSLYYINEAFKTTESITWFYLALFALFTNLIGLSVFLRLDPIGMSQHDVLNITMTLGIVSAAFAFTAMYSLFYELGGRLFQHGEA